ncbi:DUF2330 domain-containing protein [Flindersiella endophytica]
MARMFRSVCALVLLLVTCSALGVAAPAWACGCGAYIPDRAEAAVVDERALVTWDGSQQDILMSFNVDGSSHSAAWVMPVPSAAKVTLGDPEVFEELDELTEPRVEYRDSWWPTFTWLFDEGDGMAGAPRDSAVQVLGRQQLGPFDVTRLSAGDPSALATWLADNGFPHPEGLDDNLAPYVSDGWETVAIRLLPAGKDASLAGELQPLRLSFASSTLVYPMRLSKAADNPQKVELYVLADHRMDPRSVPATDERPELAYAGRVKVGSTGEALRAFVGDGAFLTHWTNYIGRPEKIDGDYVFARAKADTPYQQVEVIERNRGDITGLIILGVLAIGIAAVVIVVLRRRRRPSTPASPAS